LRGGLPQRPRQVSAAGRKVQDAFRSVRSHDASRFGAPKEIKPTAEKMIGEIITPRDGGKRSADKTGILLWKDRFDAD
jgi:hypothetical protein